MSKKIEIEHHHLTPSGWELGTIEGGIDGGCEIEPPNDRVLTLLHIMETTQTGPSVYDTETGYSKKIDWESEDKSLIEDLKNKFGEIPPEIADFHS